MDRLWQLGAVEIATRIRTGEVTSRDVVEAHLARIDEVDPRLNAIVRRFDERALAEADAADAALRVAADDSRLDSIGPLHGVPFTVKENIDLAGTPTTRGIPALADAVASVDAPVVERLRRAGAIPIGRTNMPDVGLRVHTHSTLHGLTRNPWHAGRTAGGSSGGEAAAIASGMSPLGLGNDIGGSLRNPAHCCGITSIKPTLGVVPTATVVPPYDMMLAAQQMLCDGPLARHVADVRAALVAIAGWSARDPRSVPAVLADLGDGERVRVAVLADPPGGETHPEIAAAVRRAGELLVAAGHDVVEATPPAYEETARLWAMLLIADLEVQRPVLDPLVGDAAREVIDLLVSQHPAPTMRSAAELQAARHGLMRAWSGFFQEHQLLLTPTWCLPAFAHGADLGGDGAALVRHTLRAVLPANVLGLPAAVVPCGTADGLPVGVQVIGDRFTDLRCLAVAQQVEDAAGVPTPIDPVVDERAGGRPAPE